MSSAGEFELIKGFAEMRRRLAASVREVRPDGLSTPACAEILDHLIAMEKSITGLKLLVADRGARSPEDLARRSGTSKAHAKDTIETAKKVKKNGQLEDAIRDGQLSERQASAVADAADANPGATTSLLDKARSDSLHGLKDACGKAKAAADPDEDATQRRIHRRRFFRRSRDGEGASVGVHRGTAAAGAKLEMFLAPFRNAVFTANRTAGKRDSDEAMDFDALMAMAEAGYTHLTGACTDAVKAKSPAHVYVSVDWDTLVDQHAQGQEAAYMHGHGPVPVSFVQDLIDDNAFLIGVIRHGTEVAKINRFGSYIPAELRDALLVKHQFRCSTPGCNNWAHLEIDHKHPRGLGGPTSYDNLDPLCKPCHKRKTAADRPLFDQHAPQGTTHHDTTHHDPTHDGSTPWDDTG